MEYAVKANEKTKASEIIKKILPEKPFERFSEHATCFAPSNIALIKYWGKRDEELNLPNTSSLSITLPNKGTRTSIKVNKLNNDQIIFNGELLDRNHKFYLRLKKYLDLFRNNNEHKKIFFDITTDNNIPTAAGLASSASGFAALVMCLNQLFSWNLSNERLSLLARLGSGSACRSFWPGFVEWQMGEREDGLDSFGELIFHEKPWPELRLGLLVFSSQEKPMGSTEAMSQTVKTSKLYKHWPDKVKQDLINIREAIDQQNFTALGEITEQNSITMHETMLTSEPSINYSEEETQACKEKVWKLRNIKNIPVYFTQDAGPNLKLIFLKQDELEVKKVFPNLETVNLF